MGLLHHHKKVYIMRNEKGYNVMLELYLDEAGNTGTNFLDDKQPYFVYGGWLIEKEKENEICEGIERIFCNSKAKELKAKKGLKYDKIKELFDMMMFDFHAIPVFGVADKKYMVGAKIIETFFDHVYNPNVNAYLTGKTELKKALADSIYSNKSLLIEFSKIIHDGTIELETMRKIKEILSSHFMKGNLFDVQKSISELSDSNLQEMIKEFESISKNGTQKRWLTLVLPILMDRLQSVDKYSGKIREKVNLYVDELWGYQDIFDKLSEIFEKETIIKNIKFIKQCKSDENLLIQAADLLCGFVNSTLISNEVSINNKIVNKIWRYFISINAEFVKTEIVIWDYYAHSTFIYKILYLGGCTVTEMEEDCYEIIQREFPIAICENKQ